MRRELTHPREMVATIADSPMYFGSGKDGININGAMEELAYYNYALSSTQVENHWLVGTGQAP